MFKFDCSDIVHTTAFKIKDVNGYCVWNYILTNENKKGEYVVNQTLQDIIRLHLTKIVEKSFEDGFNISDYRLKEICCCTYSFVSNNGNVILFCVNSDEATPMNSEHKWFKTCQEAVTEGKL